MAPRTVRPGIPNGQGLGRVPRPDEDAPGAGPAPGPPATPPPAPPAPPVPPAPTVDPPAAAGRKREIRVPFSTRIRVETADQLDAIAGRRGLSKQAAVDQALAEWIARHATD